MKTRLFTILLVLLFAQPHYALADYADGEVLVKFKNGISAGVIQNTIKAYSMNTHSAIASLGVYRLKLPSDYTVEEMVEMLSEDPDIEYAEPNYIRYVSITPDDLHADQWAFQNTGQTLTCNPCYGSSTGTGGSDINAITGWDTQTGADTVTIAIIDTGVDLDHPDLKNKIIAGYDYVNNDSVPDDDHGHGTHVAGIAAAETNNGMGIAGVCWECKIMPLKVLDSFGAGFDSDIASAVEFAVSSNADIINLSLGAAESSSTLENALKSAYENNVVSVCAAGNEGAAVSYPAAYDNYCIAVAATDNRDKRIFFSNFGPEIDVAAPGVDIYSTYRTGGADMSSACKQDPSNPGYGFCSGTSMASPFVAGLAGVILSQNPAYSVDQVTFRIIQTAEDVNSSSSAGFDNLLGGGRIKLQPDEIETVNINIDDDSGACFISAVK